MKWRALILILNFTFSAFADVNPELEETVELPEPDQFRIQVENAALWQTQNVFRLPGNTGTQIDLADINQGPFYAPRFLAEWNINEWHGLRLLIAPLSFNVSYIPTQNISIRGQIFTAGNPVTTTFKFNSYRLTYRYFFESSSSWKFRLGLTAKIRDANIATTDGIKIAQDPNLGFVPLIHFGVKHELSAHWFADLDIDALGAPQGRAEDVALRLGYVERPWELSLGYRFLEGGADNDRVYTFAFFHYAFFSAAFTF